MQNQVVVLDIGSSKVTALIGERGVNKTFLIKGFSEREYSGFTDGQFLDVQSFSGAVKAAIREVREITRVKIAKVYVGVPGEFTTVITKNHHIAFSKRKKSESATWMNFSTSLFRSKERVTASSTVRRSGMSWTITARWRTRSAASAKC